MVDSNAHPKAEALQIPVDHIVGRSRAGRKLGWALGILLVTLPVVLIVVPWQQTVPGAGRVTAFDPLDRIQVIPAPVSGRLTKLNVREGTRVKKGQELAVMEDLDPEFSARLDQQLGFARVNLEAAHTKVEAKDKELDNLQRSLESALEGARLDFAQAVEKVKGEEQKLKAEEEDLTFLTEDFGRQTRLLALGQASEQKQQKAEADYGAQTAKVAAALSAVEQARKQRDSKQATIDKVRATEQAKIEKVRGEEQDARGKLEDARKAVTQAESAQARQATQVILSPRDGTVLRAAGANSADLIDRGETLIEIIPDTSSLAVEVWLRGIDAPLVELGRKSRLQFEGWPAVQFAGWPSVAVGTFGGVVAQVDAQAAVDGRVRVLIVPDPEEDPWPAGRYLRQGVRASGWVQLETVSTGYELWRQLNAFPPSLQTGPEGETTGKKKGASKGKSKADDSSKGGK